MTHADPIAADGLKLELNQLWMLPLVLFQMICGFFSNEQTFLHEHRRKRSAPADWQDHIPGLLETEWAIAAIKAEGARRVLAGAAIDFNTIPIPPPPGDWQPLVKDAADLLRRFEAVASFHADPEKFIRRHADGWRCTTPPSSGCAECHLPRMRGGGKRHSPRSHSSLDLPPHVAKRQGGQVDAAHAFVARQRRGMAQRPPALAASQ